MRTLGILGALATLALIMQTACVNTPAPLPATQKPAQAKKPTASTANQTQVDLLNPHQGKVMVIGLKGQISKNALEKVTQSIGQVSGDPIPAGLIVLISQCLERIFPENFSAFHKIAKEKLRQEALC